MYLLLVRMLSSPVLYKVPPLPRSGTHRHTQFLFFSTVLFHIRYTVLCLHTCYSRWFKDSRLLTDQEKYQTYSELRSGVLVLVIKNLTERDLGHYECEVG